MALESCEALARATCTNGLRPTSRPCLPDPTGYARSLGRHLQGAPKRQLVEKREALVQKPDVVLTLQHSPQPMVLSKLVVVPECKAYGVSTTLMRPLRLLSRQGFGPVEIGAPQIVVAPSLLYMLVRARVAQDARITKKSGGSKKRSLRARLSR